MQFVLLILVLFLVSAAAAQSTLIQVLIKAIKDYDSQRHLQTSPVNRPRVFIFGHQPRLIRPGSFHYPFVETPNVLHFSFCAAFPFASLHNLIDFLFKF